MVQKRHSISLGLFMYLLHKRTELHDLFKIPSRASTLKSFSGVILQHLCLEQFHFTLLFQEMLTSASFHSKLSRFGWCIIWPPCLWVSSHNRVFMSFMGPLVVIFALPSRGIWGTEDSLVSTWGAKHPLIMELRLPLWCTAGPSVGSCPADSHSQGWPTSCLTGVLSLDSPAQGSPVSRHPSTGKVDILWTSPAVVLQRKHFSGFTWRCFLCQAQ